MAGTQGMTIADAAERTGLTPDTLRYYEKDGLLVHPVERASSGYRSYSDDDISWIVLVTRLRSTGMPIRDVRRYADLVREGEGTEQARLDLLRAHRENVLARLAEVQDHLAAVDYKIGIYEDRLSTVQELSA